MPGQSHVLSQGHLFLTPPQWIISFSSKGRRARLREVEEFAHGHTETKISAILLRHDQEEFSLFFARG